MSTPIRWGWTDAPQRVVPHEPVAIYGDAPVPVTTCAADGMAWPCPVEVARRSLAQAGAGR